MSRNYSRISDPQLSDLIQIWDASNSDWRLVTFSDAFALFQESYTTMLLEPDSQNSAPVTGADVAVNDNDNDTHLILTPAGTLATLTITLPAKANLRDKQTVLVTSTQVLTALTVAANGVSAVNGAPAAMTANGYFKLKYDLTLDSWNRVG